MTSALHPMPGVPRDTTRRIGLLGGSFNPAHEGHRHISLEALKRLGLDEVWWLVSPQNPLKTDDGMEPLATRVARARQHRRPPSAHPGRCARAAARHALHARHGAGAAPRLSEARFVWLMGADILPQLAELAGLARAVRGHPDRGFRAAGLELSGAGRGSPARLRPLPDRCRARRARLPPASRRPGASSRAASTAIPPRRSAPCGPADAKRKERPSPDPSDGAASFPTGARTPRRCSRWCAVRWTTTRPRTSSSSTSRASRPSPTTW